MKAIVLKKYGPPDVLHFEEIQKPLPRDNEVLVKVHASSVTFSNLGLVTGKPFLIRLMGGGFLKPKRNILGTDMSGIIEAVGREIKLFKPGDEVFGDLSKRGYGAFAEYVCVPEDLLAPKPSNLSFEEAAAVPESALVALQALRDYGKIREGHKVLVYGASGGIGTFTVQIAKAFGAIVTGVCSTKNLNLVSSLGADYVIDYTKEDFTKKGQKYDIIVATAGYRSIFDYRNALVPGGTHVATGGSMKGPHALSQIFQPMLLGPFISKQGKKLKALTLNINQNDLYFLKELIEAGKIKPVIDRCYKLSEVATALKYYSEGHTKGKIVISVNKLL